MTVRVPSTGPPASKTKRRWRDLCPRKVRPTQRGGACGFIEKGVGNLKLPKCIRQEDSPWKNLVLTVVDDLKPYDDAHDMETGTRCHVELRYRLIWRERFWMVVALNPH